MSSGKDNPDLGPPFHSKSSKPSAKKVDDDDGSQFSPSFEPLLVDSPYYVRERGRPFEVGSGDVGFVPGVPGEGSGAGGGMIVGPDHPGFWRPDRQPMHPSSPTILPPGAVPPRARFDPITPLAPGSYPDQVWPSGEPDPDMEPMSGPQIDPVQPGWKPPRGPPGPPTSGGGGKVGGAPFFF